MPGSGERLRRTAVELRQGELSLEKDFYLEEFRGRSVLVAVAPGAADLGPLAGAVGDLVRNDTRVLLCWFDRAPAAERRLRAALGRAKGLGGRRASGLGPVVRMDGAALARADAEALRAELWGILRHERLCVRAVESAFPGPARALATALRIPKLVLVDPEGGLLAGQPQRLSFVDAHVLDTLLGHGEAEWSGLGGRRALLVAVRDALEGSGERLVGRLLAEAAQRGLAYVFACAVDERAVQFFLRLGFDQVGAERVPAAKWVGYDARRRARVVVCRHELHPGPG